MAEVPPFGAWLKRRRRALGLTQEELAVQVGCSTVALRKIEAEERRASSQIAGRLALSLAVPLEAREPFVRFARGELAAGEALGPPDLAAYREPVSPPTRPPSPRLPLPTFLTSLIGREEESAEALERLARPEIRLLTFIGPPGIGKTRLALKVVSDLAGSPAYFSRVAYVPLGEIRDPGLVLPAIAHAVGIKPVAGREVEAVLRNGFSDQPWLLLIDNFEQVIGAGEVLASLLRDCAGLCAIVTSRAALRLEGEFLMPVLPLVLPSLEAPPPIETLAGYSAVGLFVARAQAIRPEFVLDERNASAVTAICTRVDGLPLAIELLAACMNVLTPQALLERMGGKFVLYADGLRGRPVRQQTMSSAIQWSVDLLSDSARVLLARLGVFVGGFTLEAAQAVAGQRGDILPDLTSLLDSSLLSRLGDSRKAERFAMLGTIREFAQAQTEASHAGDDLSHRHARFFVSLAERASHHLTGADQREWRRLLDEDHDNLRAALEWSLQSSAGEDSARIGGAIWSFWLVHGHVVEGRGWLDRVLAYPEFDRLPAPARSDVLNGAAVLAGLMGDFRRATELQEKRLHLLRSAGDQHAAASALNNLGMLALEQGNLDRAQDLFREARAVFEGLEDQAPTAVCLHNLGLVAILRGELGPAREFLEDGLELSRNAGAMRCVAWCITELGLLFLLEGDLANANHWLKESLALKVSLGDRETLPWSLEGLAELALALEQPARAAALFAAAQAQREDLGIPLPGPYRPDFDRNVARASASLGPEAMEQAWRSGAAMTAEDVLTFSLGAAAEGEPGRL